MERGPRRAVADSLTSTLVRISEHAAEDLRQAHHHYKAIDPSLSTAFSAAVDPVIDRIRTFPQGAPPVDGFPGIRRARVRRFPYGVFYRNIDQSTVLVVRVLHSARGSGV